MRHYYPAPSIEDLLISLREILSAEVIEQLQASFDALRESELGAETVLISSRRSIVDGIVQSLRRMADSPDDAPKSSPWVTVVYRHSNQSGRGRGGGRGRGRESDVRSEPGEGKGRPDPTATTTPGGLVFFGVKIHFVDLTEYTTPPKGAHPVMMERPKSIRERARIFGADKEIMKSAAHYEPTDSVSGLVTLYHGSRLVNFDSFCQFGVKPTTFDTEFSTAPAFYVTNQVTAAFEFPLHNRRGLCSQDTGIVFEFSLNVEILHGLLKGPHGQLFRVMWFEYGRDDDEWAKFCSYNLYGPRPKEDHPYDIVIEQLCYPDFKNRTVVPRPGCITQVAFCTKESWEWLEACVVTMHVERRIEIPELGHGISS